MLEIYLYFIEDWLVYKNSFVEILKQWWQLVISSSLYKFLNSTFAAEVSEHLVGTLLSPTESTATISEEMLHYVIGEIVKLLPAGFAEFLVNVVQFLARASNKGGSTCATIAHSIRRKVSNSKLRRIRNKSILFLGNYCDLQSSPWLLWINLL